MKTRGVSEHWSWVVVSWYQSDLEAKVCSLAVKRTTKVAVWRQPPHHNLVEICVLLTLAVVASMIDRTVHNWGHVLTNNIRFRCFDLFG